jgi:hypothetical protein
MDVHMALRALNLAPPPVRREDELEQWKDDVLRPTYRAWQKVVHPDVNRHSDATDQSRRVNEAYGVLQDLTLRDLDLAPPRTAPSGGPRRIHRRVRVQRGREARIVVRIPFSDVVVGVYW